jgi:hypothetical protein
MRPSSGVNQITYIHHYTTATDDANVSDLYTQTKKYITDDMVVGGLVLSHLLKIHVKVLD